MAVNQLSVPARCAEMIRRMVLPYADRDTTIILSRELYDLLKKYFVEYNGIIMIFGFPVMTGSSKELPWNADTRARLYVVFNNTVEEVLRWYDEWTDKGWLVHDIRQELL